MSEPTGAARRRGPFKVGDQVQLTDPKGRHYTFTLEAGKNFHTHKGSFPHDELIGAPEGSVVRTTGNVAYLALRPLLPDYVLSMPRGAAVVYPKDAGQILAFADIFPGARVVEAGVGSGSLSSFLLRAIGDQGMLHSYERREDFAEIAQQNVERYFGGPHPAWQLTVGDLQDNLSDTDVDRVILDMLAPGSAWRPSPRPSSPAASSAATSRPPPSSRAPSSPSARSAPSTSRPRGRRCSATGTSRAWPSAPTTG